MPPATFNYAATQVRFIAQGQSWEDLFEWVKYDARIEGADGTTVFEQSGVEFPAGWDQHSVNIVAQKYFWGDPAVEERESSLRQLIKRVVGKVVEWVEATGTLPALGLTKGEFFNELAFMIADQRFSFNSPVWFNVGVEEKPQCSACFILSVEDNMLSIADNAKAEMLIFKHGSGAGSNRGRLRSQRESVRGGGHASGPLSFIRIYDTIGGSVKSGGKTRRAAKMEILDVDHLDVREFISFKRDEERKARILVDGGVDGSFCGEAYSTVSGQNANYSVRVSDEFMQAVKDDETITLRGRHDEDLVEVVRARDLWDLINQCAWECADPGLQFDGVIQKMHTCANRDRIYATNPCSEYVFLDDTSCNLASHNLVRYVRPDGTFDVDSFRHAVSISAVAMDSFIDQSFYPTKKIEVGTRTYRTLGIGFTSLGALLMRLGVPYDSGEAQMIAGSITSVLGSQAYLASAAMAERAGAFGDYEHNASSFAEVMGHHRKAADKLSLMVTEGLDAGMNGSVGAIAGPLSKLGAELWSQVERMAMGNDWDHGFRNAQGTVLAPTGTTSFMMGAQSSTGIEPVLGLVTFKNLAGGGLLKQVNPEVGAALENLGYAEPDRRVLLGMLEETGSLRTSPDVQGEAILKPEHRSIFVTSFPDPVTGESLTWKAHVDMMAACQPFISGAISKTINMPESASADDIGQAYMYAYDKGLKCVAVYRDNSKGVQAVGTRVKTTAGRDVQDLIDEVRGPAWGDRVRLPTTRLAVTTKFAITEEGGVETKGFLSIGIDESGAPKELFMTFDKVGGTVQGFMHAWCKSASFVLQLGMPLKDFAHAFAHTRFAPFGRTDNPDIPTCNSIPDFVAKFLLLQFESDEYQFMAGSRPVKGTTRISDLPALVHAEEAGGGGEDGENAVDTRKPNPQTGNPCGRCGAMMVRLGGCEQCMNCGANGGCSGG